MQQAAAAAGRNSSVVSLPEPLTSTARFSTASFRPQDRLAAWRELYGRRMCKVDIEPIDAETFHTDVTLRRMPGLSLMRGHRSPALYRRKRTQLESDNVFVTVSLAGGFEATQLGRHADMVCGDALVGTGAEPMDFAMHASCRSVTLSVPLAAISPRVANPSTHYGRRIPADNPALRLMTRYVEVIEQPAVLASPDLLRQAVTHVHDLLALALGATADATQIAQTRGARAARLSEIKSCIEENLGDQRLSIRSVAARHRLAVRYVQRLFESEGITFTGYVLERRLARAHRLLSDPRLLDRPIGTLAFEAGFTNQPYFNRTFRTRFGAAPSDIRALTRREH